MAAVVSWLQAAYAANNSKKEIPASAGKIVLSFMEVT
jgi:hypothetical protein